MPLEAEQSTAEQRFRQAFERLKADEPKVLRSGSLVSQNNVAKEAGCDPSALRKTRFPSLIREIQAYVEIRQQAQPSKRQQQIKQRKSKAESKNRLKEVAAQRDNAQSQLASAHRRIVELSEELKLLRARLDELRPTQSALNGQSSWPIKFETSSPMEDRHTLSGHRGDEV